MRNSFAREIVRLRARRRLRRQQRREAVVNIVLGKDVHTHFPDRSVAPPATLAEGPQPGPKP